MFCRLSLAGTQAPRLFSHLVKQAAQSGRAMASTGQPNGPNVVGNYYKVNRKIGEGAVPSRGKLLAARSSPIRPFEQAALVSSMQECLHSALRAPRIDCVSRDQPSQLVGRCDQICACFSCYRTSDKSLTTRLIPSGAKKSQSLAGKA